MVQNDITLMIFENFNIIKFFCCILDQRIAVARTPSVNNVTVKSFNLWYFII